ncbi:MAG: winged helix-turn-helix domain-containing protein, partial [Nitrospirota bacterium]
MKRMRSPCHLFFETLATDLKINIIERLREGPSGVSELSNALGHERSKVSHALLSLYECGFVQV